MSSCSGTLSVVSNIIGWLYFGFWGISFYGQIYENYICKSVEGMAFDFVALNLTGFLFLSTYSTVGYFNHDKGIGQVEIQDLAFAYNAVFATILTIIQAFYYPKGKNAVRPWCIALLVALWSFTIIYGLTSEAFNLFNPGNSANIFVLMGYEKLLISFVKYIPQVYWNWYRQSTEGWSIFNILCDFMGGMLSFLQIVIDDICKGETNIFKGNLNVVKFVLSLIAMGFDIIFMTQHYLLYPESKRAPGKEKNKLMVGDTNISIQGQRPVQIGAIE